MKSSPKPPRIRSKPPAAVDGVVAVAALDVVVAEEVGDDVVAVAAVELSLPAPPSMPVVAAVAPERVVALAGAHPCRPPRAAEDDVLARR